MCCSELRVLFYAAAGARRGFGHLVRCRSLARALRVRPLVAMRGGQRTLDVALALGCDVVAAAGPRAVARLRPDVLVVDDPVARTAGAWIAAGRRAGCLVVSVHDLGLGCLEADLVVDGSVTRTKRALRGASLTGPRYAVLDPAVANKGRRWQTGARVLISLGGGPRAHRAAAIADALARMAPEATIRIAAGFVTPAADTFDGRVTWIRSPRWLTDELSRADVAVLGGGVTLYEACALGVPAVAIPVVRSQEPTVAAFASKGAALGLASAGAPAQDIARQAARLLRDTALRRQVSRRARTLVDGRGAKRVAEAIGALAAVRWGARRRPFGAWSMSTSRHRAALELPGFRRGGSGCAA